MVQVALAERSKKYHYQPSGEYTSNGLQQVIAFSDGLGDRVDLTRLNEVYLDNQLNALEMLGHLPQEALCLALTRLTELALHYTGNLANHGCIPLVGDMIFNPRLVHVYIKGRQKPVVKERHTPLTLQFEHCASTPGGVVRWLKSNTITDTVKKPLLPCLVEQLEKLPCPGEYPAKVKQRVSDIITLSCQLSGSLVPSGMNIWEWISTRHQTNQEAIRKLIYRGDETIFIQTGEKLRRLSITIQ